MTLGDYITWGTALIGAWALLRLAYKRWQPTIRSLFLYCYYVIDDYVALWQESQSKTNAGLPDTYQAEPPAVPVVRSGSVPVPNHDLRLQLIDVMARMVDDTGKHIYSANYISEVARGTRADVLDQVRSIRGNPPEPVEPYNPAKHLLLDGGGRWIAR